MHKFTAFFFIILISFLNMGTLYVVEHKSAEPEFHFIDDGKMELKIVKKASKVRGPVLEGALLTPEKLKIKNKLIQRYRNTKSIGKAQSSALGKFGKTALYAVIIGALLAFAKVAYTRWINDSGDPTNL